MADIGVFHNSLAAGGGAEAVGAHAVAAMLDAGHAVTLYADTPVDLPAVNAYHGTDIDPDALAVRVLDGPGVRLARRAIGTATAVAGVEAMPLLRNAVADRALRRADPGHDLLFSTQGELFASGAVQYVHFPYYAREAMERYGTRFGERLYPAYHRLCRAAKPLETPPAVTLTNSAWTAGVIEEVYGLETTVLHPPVRVGAFDPAPWDDREDGFVAVGRVHHLKRQATLVEIVDRLRQERDIYTHLHLVGPVGQGAYANRVRQLAAAREHVTIEGEVPRERLVRLLETHKYGLHGRRFEHFGIAVAEMVAAGMVPFVHRSGGQVEVVGSPALTYDRADGAVGRIAMVVGSPLLLQQLREQLSAAQYGTERFGQRLRTVIRETV